MVFKGTFVWVTKHFLNFQTCVGSPQNANFPHSEHFYIFGHPKTQGIIYLMAILVWSSWKQPCAFYMVKLNSHHLVYYYHYSYSYCQCHRHRHYHYYCYYKTARNSPKLYSWLLKFEVSLFALVWLTYSVIDCLTSRQFQCNQWDAELKVNVSCAHVTHVFCAPTVVVHVLASDFDRGFITTCSCSCNKLE